MKFKISFYTNRISAKNLVAYCKMISFIHLVLLFSLLLVGLATNTSTSSTGTKNALNQNMTTARNLTNASCNSDLRIDKSAVENILRLSHNYATHVVEIEVSVNSGNKTEELKWSWADEIGRTIISLKATFSEYKINSSSLYTFTLYRGIKRVNVVVENYGCLPNESNRSQVVFDFLLHQLCHSDNSDYKLCRMIDRKDVVKKYKCCRVASGRNLTICAEYLSVLLEYMHARYHISVILTLMLYFGLPLIHQYLKSIPKQTEYYSITDSPMALSSIFYAVFLERSNNPVTPYYRRLTFSLAVVVIITTCFLSLFWIKVSLTWALIFTAYDFFGLNSDATKNIEAYLTILTLPFNIKYWWKFLKLPTDEQPPEHLTNLLEDNPNSQQSPTEDPQITTSQKRSKSSCTAICCSIIIEFFKVLFFVIAYTVFFLPIGVFITTLSPFLMLCSLGFRQNKKIVRRCNNNCVLFGFTVLYALLLVFLSSIIALSLTFFVNILLYLIIGLYLNGSYFSPVVVPILILLVYSWRNWRFVETKYLQLKTTIYECCEEYYEKKSSEKKNENEESKRDTSIPTTSASITTRNHQESEETTEDLNRSYPVNIKEGTVSKALYDKIRDHRLPYNEVLFYFFIRMYFVAIFCLIVFLMMSLAQKSDINVPVQIMSTIAVSTFPLIFETIWADHSSEQKNVNRKKLKRDLNSIMNMDVKHDNIVTVQLMLKDKKTKVTYSLYELLNVQ